MRITNLLILDSSQSDTGGWINISQLSGGFSLHVVGLEGDGKIQVNLHNAFNVPNSQQFDTEDQAAAYTTINGSNGEPVLSMQNVMAMWLQVVKLPGTAPTETTVRIFGQSF